MKRHLVGALTAVILANPTSLGIAQASDAAVPVAPSAADVSTPTARDIVRQRASRSGWASGRQWACLTELIRRESRWNPNATNPNSSARGLFQVLRQKPGLPVAKQAEIGIRYITARHHTPCKALAFHTTNGWY